jgi:hypothetical protein
MTALSAAVAVSGPPASSASAAAVANAIARVGSVTGARSKVANGFGDGSNPGVGSTDNSSFLRKRRREDSVLATLASYGSTAQSHARGVLSTTSGGMQSTPSLPSDPRAKPGKGYKFCHECGKLVANRRFVCVHCGAKNPSSKIVKRPRCDIPDMPVIAAAAVAAGAAGISSVAAGAAGISAVVAARRSNGTTAGAMTGSPGKLSAYRCDEHHTASGGISPDSLGNGDTSEDDDQPISRGADTADSKTLSMRDRRDALFRHAKRTSSDSCEDTPSESESDIGEGATLDAEE